MARCSRADPDESSPPGQRSRPLPARRFPIPCPVSISSGSTRPSAREQTPFEAELAQLIVEAVNLDTPAADIDPTAPLFNEGLGLDSIDLLEIALAVSQRFGCELRSDDPENPSIFASLRNLAAHIAGRRSP